MQVKYNGEMYEAHIAIGEFTGPATNILVDAGSVGSEEKIVVIAWDASAEGTNTIVFQETGDSTPVSHPYYLVAGGGFVESQPGENLAWFECAADKGLAVGLTESANVSVGIIYVKVKA